MKKVFRYYRPEIETASREVIEILQLKKLKYQLQHVYEHSPFYNQKFRNAGLHPEDIKSLEDLNLIPFTTKEELLQSQQEYPLFGNFFCVEQKSLSRVFQTSGTTGIPLKVGFTRRDWDIFAEMWCYHGYGYGLTKEDAIFIPFNYGLFIAFWGTHYGFEKMGLCIIPGGGQSSDVRIKNILEWRPTVICGTPTYILHLGEVAQSMGIDPKENTVRVVITGGEPGALIPATKKRMEELWSAEVYDQVGSSEIGPHSFECKAQSGGCHVLEDHYCVEVIDLANDKRKVRPGEEGELVLTNLSFEGMPLIRYRLRDIVKANYEQCSCGRTFVRFDGGVLGRVDSMVLIGGVNIFPTALENIIRGIEVFSNEFQIVVSSKAKLKLRVEPLNNQISEGKIQEATKSLIETIKYRIGITPLVEVAEVGKLPRFDLKAKRVVRED